MKAFLLILLIQLPLWAGALNIGDKMAPFSLMDLNGKRHSLKSFFPNSKAEQLTLFSFWSTTCAPCLKEMPVLEAYSQKNSEKIRIVYISVDTRDKDAAVGKVLIEKAIKSPNLRDFYQVLGKKAGVCSAQGACQLPQSLLINAQGVVLAKLQEFKGKEHLEKELDHLLSTSQNPQATAQNTAKKSKEEILKEIAFIQQNLGEVKFKNPQESQAFQKRLKTVLDSYQKLLKAQ